MKTRFVKLLPTIIAGIFYGVIWYHYTIIIHAFIIGMIWMDIHVKQNKKI